MLSVEHGFFGKTLSFSPTVFAFLFYQFVFINDLPACPVVSNFVPLENCIRSYWFIGYNLQVS